LASKVAHLRRVKAGSGKVAARFATTHDRRAEQQNQYGNSMPHRWDIRITSALRGAKEPRFGGD